MDSKQQYKVIGLMSGTSLDGLDLAYCTFTYHEGWKFNIEHAATLRYLSAWSKKLSEAHLLSAEALLALDVEYGKFLGKACLKFMADYKIKSVDFISSHGHTVFHQPKNGFTFQLGNGNAIHAVTNLPVVFDFRSLDVMHGGQGAPLVPIGDALLFQEYDICLNLGGIANLSLQTKKGREAFDICFVNMGLNYLAEKAGKKFDRDGGLARKGEVNVKMLKQLRKVYDKMKGQRPSLGREFFEKSIQPILDQTSVSLFDRLRTFTESVAEQVVSTVVQFGKHKTILCTGGGAFNSFLIYRFIELSGDDATFIIADEEIVKFKEACVFAFLGVLRVRDEVNCLRSVTKATQDSSSGLLAGF